MFDKLKGKDEMDTVLGIVCLLGGLFWFSYAMKANPRSVSANMIRFAFGSLGCLVFLTGLEFLGVIF